MSNNNHCPNCGTVLNGGRTCPNCGTNVGETDDLVLRGELLTDALSAGRAFLYANMFAEEKWYKVCLLSILTAGGYGCYYRFRQLKEIRSIEQQREVDNRIPFILYLILFYASASLAGIVFEIIYYKKLKEAAKQDFGVKLKPRIPIVYALLMYIPFYSWYLNVKNHNKVIRLYKEAFAAQQEKEQFENENSFKRNDFSARKYVKVDTGTKDMVTQEYVQIEKERNPYDDDYPRSVDSRADTDDKPEVTKKAQSEDNNCKESENDSGTQNKTDVFSVEIVENKVLNNDPNKYIAVNPDEISPDDSVIAAIAEEGLD